MERIAFFLYLFGIVFGVLFFGGIHAWVYTPVLLAIFAASLLLLKGEIVPVEPAAENREAVPAYGLRWLKTDLTPLFLFFFALMLIQMLPLPPWLLALISPDAKIAADMAQPAAAVALDPAAGRGAWGALAPYAFPVRMSLIRWIAYGLLFFGLLRCLRSRRRIERAIVVLLALGAFDALYGILQSYSGHGHVWWYKLGNVKDVSGTYLNRNHLAGLLAMTITLAIAYAAGKGEKRRDEGSAHVSRRHRSLNKRFLALFTDNTRNLKRFLVVFAGGVMGLGLILSASRGGIIATAAALLLMGLFFYFRKEERRKGRIILGLFAIAMLFALHAGLDYTLGRFDFFDRDLEHRWVRAERAFALFADYPVAGVGIGNFRHAYGKYQDPQDRNLYVDYAHNDYAQFLADAGILGALGLLAGLGWFLWRHLRRWRGRSDPFAVCLGIAPFAAMLALAIHSWSDYNLHRPANVMVLIAVTAIGCAALRLEGRRRGRAEHPVRLIPLRPWGAALLAGAAGLILWCGVATVRHFVAETFCSTEANITLRLDPNPPALRVRRAIAWDSGNAVYPFKLAQALMTRRDRRMMGPLRDSEGWARSHEPIVAALERAIALNPWNAEYHVRLAWEYSYLANRPAARERWVAAADLSMNRAGWFAGTWPQNPHLHYDMGNYWAMRSKGFAAGDSRGEIAWTRALWHYRQGVALERRPRLPDHIRGYLRNFTSPEAELLRNFWLSPLK
jgi:O-antigen ligase